MAVAAVVVVEAVVVVLEIELVVVGCWLLVVVSVLGVICVSSLVRFLACWRCVASLRGSQGLRAKFIADPVLHPPCLSEAKKALSTSLASLEDEALAAEIAAMKDRVHAAHSQRLGASSRLSAPSRSRRAVPTKPSS